MSQEKVNKSTQSSSRDETDLASSPIDEEQNEELDDLELDEVAGGDAGTERRVEDIEKWGG